MDETSVSVTIPQPSLQYTRSNSNAKGPIASPTLQAGN